MTQPQNKVPHRISFKQAVTKFYRLLGLHSQLNRVKQKVILHVFVCLWECMRVCVLLLCLNVNF